MICKFYLYCQTNTGAYHISVRYNPPAIIPIPESRVTHDPKSHLPIYHPQTAKLLGRARRCAVAALLLSGRRRNDEPGHIASVEAYPTLAMGDIV